MGFDDGSVVVRLATNLKVDGSNSGHVKSATYNKKSRKLTEETAARSDRLSV